MSTSGATGSVLPAGYLAAEFLESTGTQYIKATALFDNNTKLEMLARQTGVSSTSSFFGTEHMYTANTNSNRFSCMVSGSAGQLRFDYGSKTDFSSFYIEQGVCYKITKDAEKNYIDGVLVFSNAPAVFDGLYGVLFARGAGHSNGSNANGGLKCAIYWCNVFNSGKPEHAFVPALTDKGIPCMYDKVTKTQFRNSGGGRFIVGMTCKQALKLAELPAGGGELTVSLPSNWQDDEGVVTALATAEANGWVLTYQTYDADASTASTLALRRIFVRKTQNDNGQYVAADGSRWHVEWCAGMIGAEPTDHGYEPFRSVDAAVAYWGLTPYVDPEAENLLTELEQ